VKNFKTIIAVMALTLGTSTTANAQLFGGFDNNTILGGATGAGLGALLGAEIAPRGNNTEGAAIGALVGGLAGASYGNQRSNFAGNPYAGQFNPGFNGRNLVGTGTGAVLGGVIGSNLAGRGVRQEGTALGAVLGGVAGYALSNRGQGQQFQGQQFQGQPFQGAQFQGQPQLIGQSYSAPIIYGAQPSFASSAPISTGSSFITSSAPSSHSNIVYATPPAQSIVQHQGHLTPDITYAAPNLRLAGPEIREQVVYSDVTYVEHMPIARAEHYTAPPRVVYQSAHIPTPSYTVQQPVQHHVQPHQHQQPATLCYAGHSKQYDSWGQAIKPSPTCR
jgi:outer membrane lipoprotein SlyB